MDPLCCQMSERHHSYRKWLVTPSGGGGQRVQALCSYDLNLHYIRSSIIQLQNSEILHSDTVLAQRVSVF